MIPDLPDFLRREDTEASRKNRERIVAAYRDRKIKNPPKRAKRTTKLLGRGFGMTVKPT